jgi:hypothetical protein
LPDFPEDPMKQFHTTCVILLLFAVALTLAPAPADADENKIEEATRAALETVYKRALKRCESLLDEVSELIARDRGPVQAHREYAKWIEQMAALVKEARSGIADGHIRDEDAEFADYVKLDTIAGDMGIARARTIQALDVLDRAMTRLLAEYAKVCRDMDEAAAGERFDVFTEEERKKFEERLEKLQDDGEKAVDEAKDGIANRWPDLMSRARGTNDAGKRLAAAASKYLETVVDRLEVRLATVYRPVLDWENPATPSGYRLMKYGRDADERFRSAREALQDLVDELEITEHKDQIEEEVAKVIAEVQALIESPVIGTSHDDFLEDEERYKKEMERLLGEREPIFKKWTDFAKRAKEQAEEQIENLYELCSTRERRETLEREYRLGIDAPLTIHSTTVTRLCGSDWREHPVFRLLQTKIEQLGRVHTEVQNFVIVVKRDYGKFGDANYSVGQLDALPSMLGQTAGLISTVMEGVETIDFNKRWTALQNDANKLGYELEWTEWNARQLTITWTKKVITAWSSHLNHADKLTKAMINFSSTLSNLRNRVNGRDPFVDEFIDDPDEFMEVYVTNDMFDELDAVDFPTLKAVKDRTDPDLFQKVMEDQIKSLESSLKSTVANAADDEQKLVKAAVDAYMKALWGAWYRGAQAMDQFVDAMAENAQRRKDERDKERREFLREMDRTLDDMSADAVRLSADDRAKVARLIDDLEKLLEADDLSLEAARKDYEEARKEFESDLREARSTLDDLSD